VIYAGIQKFVSFIMSVHIAEVMQIFACIAIGIPVMRSPLQILFLILVTDLPPSIALGMEPGDSSVLKQRPRPREEPVVLPFMWLAQIMNGACLTLVIMVVYIIALMHFCDGEILQENITNIDGLKDARTVAFISLVFSENIRAYCSRSFDKPFFMNMFGNKWMQAAILLAQLCLVIAVLVPGLSEDVLELRGVAIGRTGWLFALIGPCGTVITCEGCKVITYFQMKNYQKRLAIRQAQAPNTDAKPTLEVKAPKPASSGPKILISPHLPAISGDEIVRTLSGISDAMVRTKSGNSKGSGDKQSAEATPPVQATTVGVPSGETQEEKEKEKKELESNWI